MKAMVSRETIDKLVGEYFKKVDEKATAEIRVRSSEGKKIELGIVVSCVRGRDSDEVLKLTREISDEVSRVLIIRLVAEAYDVSEEEVALEIGFVTRYDAREGHYNELQFSGASINSRDKVDELIDSLENKFKKR